MRVVGPLQHDLVGVSGEFLSQFFFRRFRWSALSTAFISYNGAVFVVVVAPTEKTYSGISFFDRRSPDLQHGQRDLRMCVARKEAPLIAELLFYLLLYNTCLCTLLGAVCRYMAASSRFTGTLLATQHSPTHRSCQKSWPRCVYETLFCQKLLSPMCHAFPPRTSRSATRPREYSSEKTPPSPTASSTSGTPLRRSRKYRTSSP